MLLAVGLLTAWTPRSFITPRVASLGRSPGVAASAWSTNAAGDASIDRRNLLETAAAAGGLAPLLSALPANAAPDKRPVLVLGASGGTGRECVKYLLGLGRPCIAATRSGNFVLENAGSKVIAHAAVAIQAAEKNFLKDSKTTKPMIPKFSAPVTLCLCPCQPGAQST